MITVEDLERATACCKRVGGPRCALSLPTCYSWCKATAQSSTDVGSCPAGR